MHSRLHGGHDRVDGAATRSYAIHIPSWDMHSLYTGNNVYYPIKFRVGITVTLRAQFSSCAEWVKSIPCPPKLKIQIETEEFALVNIICFVRAYYSAAD